MSGTTIVAENFLQTMLQFGASFCDPGQRVPGIGESGVAGLARGNATPMRRGGLEGGINNAAQVMGWFLRLNGDGARMREFLVDECGCHGNSFDRATSGTLAALLEKSAAHVAAEVGVATARPRPAAGTTVKFDNFNETQLSWEDTFETNPVPGIGKVGAARLRADNITNAVQLVGLFMMFDGEEDRFVRYLIECGIRNQEITKPKGVLESIRNKATAICEPRQGEPIAQLPTVHEQVAQEAPSTPTGRAPAARTAVSGPVTPPSSGGWEETLARKRAARDGAGDTGLAKLLFTETARKPQTPVPSESSCDAKAVMATVLGFALLSALF